MHRRGRFAMVVGLCAIALLVVVGWVSGGSDRATAQEGPQPAPGDELRIVEVDSTAFPDVTATVALPKKVNGERDVSGNLSVSSGGLAVPVDVERLSADGQAVAVLIDNAEAVGLEAFDDQQGAAAEFLLQLDETTPVIIGSSADGVVFGPVADRDAALSAIGQLRLGGDRDWPVTLWETLDRVAAGAPVTMVVVSAGPSDSADTAPAGLTARLGEKNVRVRWVSLKSDAGPAGELRGIQQVTSVTSDELLVRLDSIAAELGTQYRLKFRVDPRAIEAAVTLEVDGSTWTSETPLPLPSPGFVAPAPDPDGAAPTTDPADRAGTPSPGERASPATPDMVESDSTSILGRHWKLLTAVSVVGLLLGIVALVLRARRPPAAMDVWNDLPFEDVTPRKPQRTL